MHINILHPGGYSGGDLLGGDACSGVAGGSYGALVNQWIGSRYGGGRNTCLTTMDETVRCERSTYEMGSLRNPTSLAHPDSAQGLQLGGMGGPENRTGGGARPRKHRSEGVGREGILQR